MISLLAVQAICNSKRPQVEANYESLLAAMADNGINTPQREAMFLAQVIHESGGFKYLEEIASGQAYEGRIDLGNTLPGDGVKFKGRGIIQIIGRANYGKCSKGLFGVEETLLARPELLANPPDAARSAGWFWSWKGLNRFCDANDFEGLTRRIAGGLSGIVERRALWRRACTALGVTQ